MVTTDLFTSESHQTALAPEGDDVKTIVTQLTKNDEAPPTHYPQ